MTINFKINPVAIYNDYESYGAPCIVFERIEDDGSKEEYLEWIEESGKICRSVESQLALVIGFPENELNFIHDILDDYLGSQN